jgi:ATP-dependent Clp protease, protease subunit
MTSTHKKIKQDIEEETETTIFPPTSQEVEEQIRFLSIYGEIKEETAAVVVSSIYAYDSFERERIKAEKKLGIKKIIGYRPIEVLLSTYGGSIHEMFAIYDVMKTVKSPIHTHGFGKVMSAGVILLAAGEKGKRKIGKNCSVMIHAVITGHSQTSIHDARNELTQVNEQQEKYVNLLAEETEGKLSRATIHDMIDSKINYYFDAKKAVEYGIADIIV